MIVVSDTITDDVTFYHRKLSSAPSLRATVEYSVLYKNGGLCVPFNSMCKPRLDFYTTEDDVNFQVNCSADSFSQFGNEKMKKTLPKCLPLNTSSRCNYGGPDTCTFLPQDHNMIHCTGEIKIQDYIPRNYFFSFSFRCAEIPDVFKTLQGLSYNIGIFDQSNETQCVGWSVKTHKVHCASLYQKTTLPNLLGTADMPELQKYLEKAKLGETLYDGLLSKGPKLLQCHKHAEEAICHLVAPKCDPMSRQVDHLCKEMCLDLANACFQQLIEEFDKIAFPQLDRGRLGVFVQKNISLTQAKQVCEYLPSNQSENLKCFYKPVFCEKPPVVPHATMWPVVLKEEHKKPLLFPHNYTFTISCSDKSFQLEGNDRITCLYSGEWSEVPRCLPVAKSPLPLVLVLIGIPLTILISIIMGYTLKPNPILSRNREFDAFVSYHFDSDHDFIISELKPQLSPKFKLFIHSEDFKPGRNITTNIQNAIYQSNSAILLLSQGYLKSGWCRMEFEHCLLESKQCSEYLLLVIAMEPVKNLINFSKHSAPQIKNFMENNVVLEKDDPNLWKKIAAHFNEVRKGTAWKDNARSPEQNALMEEPFV